MPDTISKQFSKREKQNTSGGRLYNRRRVSTVRGLIYGCGLFMILGSHIFAGGIKEDAETKIKKQFGETVSLTFKKVSLSAEVKRDISQKVKQRFYQNEVYAWKISEAKKTIGFAVLDNVKGKSLPITFMVLFDKEGKILNSFVLKYREPVGGEISHTSWNRQFTGYTPDSSFVVGMDIDGISGATISVNALTRGIHKLSYLIHTIKDEL